MLFISYHGSVGAPAGLSHTYNPRAVVEARLDGTVTGEAGINALVAAHYGVPVVLVTGDRVACEETADADPRRAQRPWSRRRQPCWPRTACTRSRACALIRETAEQAVASVRRGVPAALAARPALEVSVRTTDIAEAASWVRGRGPGRRRASSASAAMTLLAVYRSFCAAILLTRTVAEMM